ncbi:SDR family NAD(P)-dependent oxidoreductase [Legionella lytica]|uniref:SDR family NAD(P)-dependent oxidoreductase n=1 Tax=Legionella lytica TaxID=96232 RepID=A0ABW8D628_9GAMM
MKVAVITGAANGIGLALTQIHLEQDHTVVMVDKDSTKLHQEAKHLQTQFSGKILPIACDVTQADEVKALAQQTQHKLGRIDWLYNNAGIIGQLAPVWDLNAEQVKQVMNVNLHGMMHVIQAFTPFLFQQDFRSHIINMASLYALCAGSQTAPYSMSKHAVLALSESLYFDLHRLDKPVDVSVIFPSFTDTGLLSNPANGESSLHGALQSLLAHSRPAMDIAQHIMHEVAQKKFYIFPDKEVKGYCEERTQAMLNQENPHATNVEKLMAALIKRQEARRVS